MSIENLELLWMDYRRKVIPAGASNAQILETKRGFYAGASSLFKILNEIGDDSVTEDEGAAVLSGINDELIKFSEEQFNYDRNFVP